MELSKELTLKIQKIIKEQIRPRTRVDGGDIVFNHIDGRIVYVDAYGDCASCQCCEPELQIWMEKYLQSKAGVSVQIRIRKHVPYFAR